MLTAMTTALGAGLAVRFHHHLGHGPSVDYVALAVAAAASWVGLPGPGEAAVIAAGVLAARQRLDIGSVVVIAWAGAAAGGVAGWLAGLKVGRALVTSPGPLHTARLTALERGERFYARFGAFAVFLTPSWVAGIHGMAWTRYVPANAAAALAWALLFGVGSFLVGPSVGELGDDLGLAGGLALGAVLAAGVVAASTERRRRRRRQRPR